MKLELHATPEEVMRAVETLQQYARELGIPEKTAFGLALALEECGSNIVNYALRRDARESFELCLDYTGDAFVIELNDHGPPFDPTVMAVRKPQAQDEDLPGGWGIQLVRRYIDEIHYQREGGVNILRLTKKLTPPQ